MDDKKVKGARCEHCNKLWDIHELIKKYPKLALEILLDNGLYTEMVQQHSSKYPGDVFLKCAKYGKYIAKIYKGKYRHAAAITFMASKHIKQALQDTLAELKQEKSLREIDRKTKDDPKPQDLSIQYAAECPFSREANQLQDGDEKCTVCDVLYVDGGGRARCSGETPPPYCPLRKGEITVRVKGD